MRVRKARGPGRTLKRTPSPNATTKRVHVTTRPNPKPSGLAPGEKYEGTCLICGGEGTFAWGRHREGNTWITCHKCKAAGLSGGDFLRELAEYVGASDPQTLLAFPWEYLSTGTEPKPTLPPAELPSDERLAEYVAALRASRKARAYLRGRGLTRRTLRRERLGFDPGRNAIVLPVFADGELVNVRRRFLTPGREPKIVGERGRGSQLYPRPPSATAGSVIVCAGEFDALVTAQNTGIETVTSTAGAGHWNPAWSAHFARKRVAVIFDRGEHAAAEKVAAELRSVCEAWTADLGLPGKQDLTDWFVEHGRSGAELVTLIQRELRRRR